MSEVVSYERDGDIGVITVDNPPVNALGHAVRQGIVDALDKGLADDGAKACEERKSNEGEGDEEGCLVNGHR